MRRFSSSLVVSIFLLGFLLPCFAPEHIGGHAHAEKEESHSRPFHSHGQESERCCHGNILAAFYRATAKENPSLQTPHTRTLPPLLLACRLAVSHNEGHNKAFSFILDSSPTLYRLSTSLLL